MGIEIRRSLYLDTRIEGPIVELILDGCGIRRETEYNAVAFARTKFLDYLKGLSNDIKPEHRDLIGKPAYTTLTAVGEEVGMPRDAKGSTAVGHELLSGVAYLHPMLRIARSIKNGIMVNEEVDKLLTFIKEKSSTLHLIGMVSNNQEHSHIQHLYAILSRAFNLGVEKIRIHFISDGRGTPPHSAPRFVEDLNDWIAENLPERKIDIKIATIIGRDIAMNRSSATWYKTEKTLRAIVEANAPRYSTIEKAIKEAYQKGLNDQYIPPSVIGDYQGFNNYDGVILWNFRKDRMEFLARMLVDPIHTLTERLRNSQDNTYKNFNEFSRVIYKKDLNFSTIKILALVEYYRDIPCPVAFREPVHQWSLGKMLSHFGFRQYKISGVDKAKAIALLNGSKQEDLLPREKRITIPLPADMLEYIKGFDTYKGEEGYKEDPYIKFPQMELVDLTNKIIELIEQAEPFTCIMANIANPDMVGHTADVVACIKAMEIVDWSVKRITLATLKKKGIVFITADHGNIEELITEEGEPNTFHTRSPVPFIIVGAGDVRLRPDGTLKDVAPTILFFALGREEPLAREKLPGQLLIY